MNVIKDLASELPADWLWLEEMIDSGVEPLAAVLRWADDIVEDGDVDVASARRLLQQRWDRRLREESTWNEVTDGDLMNCVFSLLEEQGIRTAMGYWVSNCETTNHLLGAGSPLDGARRWCYLSVPRSDDALSEPLPKGTIEIFTQCSGDCGDGVDDEDGPCTCVVRAVQRALDEMGLTHTWNGHAYDPVLVSDLDWKMRLPT